MKKRQPNFGKHNLKQALLLSSAIAFGSSAVQANMEKSAPPLEDQLEEIIVSSAFDGKKVGESILGATVLTQDEILRRLNGTIGETLRTQPGISSTFFGAGASRPIIRGLGGDRIRVLDNGIGSIDASSTSPDHAVAVEAALAERIEILRGTAMLMYGSSAAGGVINVIDNRIPSVAPEDGFDGAVRYGYTTVDEGHEFSAAFNALLNEDSDGAKIVLHGDYFYRETEDYDIPGFAESALQRAMEEEEEHDDDHDDDDDHDEEHEDEEEVFGTLENSAVETKGGSGGLSFLFDNGFIGFNVRKLDSVYGLPGGHGHHEHDEEEGEEHDEDEEHDEEEEEDVTINLDQTRYDLMGEFSGDWGWFSKAKFRFGYSDYEHIEFEGDETGTVFSNEGWEGRLDLVETGTDNWSGATGIQIRTRDFSAIGEEAFVPPSEMSQFGIYTVKEYTTGNWRFDFGGRFEHTSYDVESIGIERSFDGFSASAGAGYDLSEEAFFGVTVFRTERAPATEELFANGPHLATDAFEIGNPDLDMETALGIEATFNYATGPFSFVANAYYTSYNDFIYEVGTDREEDELQVFEFRANDAQIFGLEARAEVHAGTFNWDGVGEIDVHFDGQFDFIEADLDRGGNDEIPRLPPASFLVGVEATSELFDLRTELEYYGEVNDVSDFELPTDSFAFWNAYFTIRPFDDKNLSFEVRATNITDSTGRQHTSFIKDQAPLPGRNFRAAFRAAF